MFDDVAGEIDAPSARVIFFMRQIRFVEDEGRAVTRHLVPLALVPEFIGDLSRRTGVAMAPAARADQNVGLKVKGALGRYAYKVNDVLWRNRPVALHTRIKDGALRGLPSQRSTAEAAGILELPEVVDSVTEHYADDIRLHERVTARTDEIRAGLRENRLERLRLDDGPAESPVR
jgi:hypothetical protein